MSNKVMVGVKIFFPLTGYDNFNDTIAIKL